NVDQSFGLPDLSPDQSLAQDLLSAQDATLEQIIMALAAGTLSQLGQQDTIAGKLAARLQKVVQGNLTKQPQTLNAPKQVVMSATALQLATQQETVSSLTAKAMMAGICPPPPAGWSYTPFVPVGSVLQPMTGRLTHEGVCVQPTP